MEVYTQQSAPHYGLIEVTAAGQLLTIKKEVLITSLENENVTKCLSSLSNLTLGIIHTFGLCLF